MDSTHVSSYFKESASDETVVVINGPCVLKSLSFSPVISISTPTDVKFIQIVDGSTDRFRVYAGNYSNYGGIPVTATIPGLGLRIDDSLKFSVEAGTTLKYITIIYQC